MLDAVAQRAQRAGHVLLRRVEAHHPDTPHPPRRGAQPARDLDAVPAVENTEQSESNQPKTVDLRVISLS